MWDAVATCQIPHLICPTPHVTSHDTDRPEPVEGRDVHGSGIASIFAPCLKLSTGTKLSLLHPSTRSGRTGYGMPSPQPTYRLDFKPLSAAARFSPHRASTTRQVNQGRPLEILMNLANKLCSTPQGARSSSSRRRRLHQQRRIHAFQ